jgi:hypothetical protein
MFCFFISVALFWMVIVNRELEKRLAQPNTSWVEVVRLTYIMQVRCQIQSTFTRSRLKTTRDEQTAFKNIGRFPAFIRTTLSEPTSCLPKFIVRTNPQQNYLHPHRDSQAQTSLSLNLRIFYPETMSKSNRWIPLPRRCLTSIA